jgi:hypothetical protein
MLNIDLSKSEDRDYAIMLAAEAGCTITGINDPTIYDAAMIDLRESERFAMLSRMVRHSYSQCRDNGIAISPDTIAAYDHLLQTYEDRYFEAKRIEDRAMRKANDLIADVIQALWDRTHQTIH